MDATIVFQKTWEAIHQLDENGKRKYKYIIEEGSSRSSKTYSLLQAYYLYSLQYPNKRLSVWRDTKKDCRDTILNDMLKAYRDFPQYNRVVFNKTESIFTFPNHTKIEIQGTDDEEKVHGYQGDAIWINEPYKISKDTFDQLDMRTTGFVFIDWNPKKAHWIEELKKDKRAITIHSTFKDNPFCPVEQKIKILSYQSVKFSHIGLTIGEQEAKGYDVLTNKALFTERQINELINCRENEHKGSANDFNWSVYGLGLKAEKPNRIFQWQEISPDEYNAINAKIYTGVDWGKVDAWGILDAKYYDGSLYLNEVNYLSENKLRELLKPTEIAQIQNSEEGFVTWYFNRFGIPKDREIICDTNRPLKTGALRRMGYTRAIPAVNKSILDGIDVLGELKVYYTSTSVNLKYEQENYSRKVDRYGIVLEEPEDMDNHLIDPARYIALYLQRMRIIKNI